MCRMTGDGFQFYGDPTFFSVTLETWSLGPFNFPILFTTHYSLSESPLSSPDVHDTSGISQRLREVQVVLVGVRKGPLLKS